MKILCIQNDLRTPPALVGQTMIEAGARLDVIAPHHCWSSLAPAAGTAALPADDQGYDALLVLGGPMHANNDDGFPALASVVRLIRSFHGADKPVLGICLGVQLIARALGGRVYRHSLTEIGFLPLDLLPAAADDPLLAGLAPRQHIMQWHEDTFDLPEGATLLMTGGNCRNQAFRMGRATYGFQCHFEVLADTARHWMRDSAMTVAEKYPEVLAGFEDGLAEHLAGASHFARTVTSRFIRLIR